MFSNGNCASFISLSGVSVSVYDNTRKYYFNIKDFKIEQLFTSIFAGYNSVSAREEGQDAFYNSETFGTIGLIRNFVSMAINKKFDVDGKIIRDYNILKTSKEKFGEFFQKFDDIADIEVYRKTLFETVHNLAGPIKGLSVTNMSKFVDEELEVAGINTDGYLRSFFNANKVFIYTSNYNIPRVYDSVVFDAFGTILALGAVS